ncbi:MAG: ribbon-helix-helix protein, CopG family [Actinomycetales bacterium]|nr:ribbon-helix-helix protein, CopG family [Actinomycetales bacterium]
MSLTHRLQLLLDEAQYQRLSARAKSEGRSVGALVREAIDLAWVQPENARNAAADAILSADRMDVPDIDELRRELDDLRAGPFA